MNEVQSKSSQNTSGRAFEFAVLSTLLEECRVRQLNVLLQETNAYRQAKRAFESLEPIVQTELFLAASAGVSSLCLLEPRLVHQDSDRNILNLYLAEDRAGQLGDVRDIVASRQKDKWSVGVSAKHNHKALKSPRLSNAATFGQAWLQIDCSEEYKDDVTKIFTPIGELCGKSTWKEFGERKKRLLYSQLLNAFKGELERQYEGHGSIVPENLLRFLLGNQDFYKLLRIGNTTQLQPFNIYGTLGKGIDGKQPVTAVRQLPLPTQFLLIKIISDTTMYLYCDNGWQISMRLHNKDSLIQPSLAFDVNLIGHPAELFTLLMPWAIGN